MCVCACVCVYEREREWGGVSVWVGGWGGVVSVTVKHPVLPPCAVDESSRNPVCYYYKDHGFIQSQQ